MIHTTGAKEDSGTKLNLVLGWAFTNTVADILVSLFYIVTLCIYCIAGLKLVSCNFASSKPSCVNLSEIQTMFFKT